MAETVIWRRGASGGRSPRERSSSLLLYAERPAEAPLAHYVLKLYVTGTSPRTETAIRNLRRICDEELSGQYELEIVDVLKSPQVAEDDRILATPTLIKQLPPPLRRVIGDLSDKEKVLLGLEVQSRPAAPRATDDSR